MDRTPTYQQLDAGHVLATVRRLQQRMTRRFPDRGLTRVAGELVQLVERVDAQTHETQTRLRWTRVLAWIGATVVVAFAAWALVAAVRDVLATTPGHATDWVPLVESGINNIVFVAIAVIFLWAAPERLERAGLLALLYRLRSLGHVVDMHQLTKEPEQFRTGHAADPAEVSSLTAEEMHHYLDYCTELLSLVAKTAALCSERSSDGTVLDAVSGIETLATDLSTKIFQKIAHLHRI